MDGPTIQEANDLVLSAGVSPLQIIDEEQEELGRQLELVSSSSTPSITPQADRRGGSNGTGLGTATHSDEKQRQNPKVNVANADTVFVGSKVFVQRDGQKTRCIVTKVNTQQRTVDIKVDPDQYAPVAQTCTFSLKVPEYSSLRVMIRQLRRAIVEEGMHLD